MKDKAYNDKKTYLFETKIISNNCQNYNISQHYENEKRKKPG